MPSIKNVLFVTFAALAAAQQQADGQVTASTSLAGQQTDGQLTVATSVGQQTDGQLTVPTSVGGQQTDGQVTVPTSVPTVAPVSQITDGQVQAPTVVPVSQISDGQIQGPTGVSHGPVVPTNGSTIAPATPSPSSFTGAANVMAWSNVAVGVVGVAALALL